MAERRLRLVDVFGARPLLGNPLAVIIDSEGLSTADMVEITRWFDFSETTFLSPPEDDGADYAVRIFTPAGELPFVGHPTLGSCHVWQSLAAESRDEIVQECGAGLVRLRRTEHLVSFEAPPLLRDDPLDPAELERLASVLGIRSDDVVAARWVDNGPGWVGLLLKSAEAVLAVQPDFGRYEGEDRLEIGIVGMHPQGSDHVYEVRALFTGSRGEMREDPVTGSLNASLAQWLIGEGRVEAPYIASQGTAVGKSGRVHITADEDGSVWVGGRVADVASGSIDSAGWRYT
jgi:PhzF family phenazine biosynthesis protein